MTAKVYLIDVKNLMSMISTKFNDYKKVFPKNP